MHLSEIRETVANFLDQQMRTDLETLQLATGFLADDRLPADELAKVASRLANITERAIARIKVFEDLILDDAVAGVTQRQPVDMRLPLRRALSRRSAGLADMHVTTEQSLPDRLTLVTAGFSQLEEVFDAILGIMLLDVRKGGVLSIVMKERDDSIETEFRSNGYGLPEDTINLKSLDASGTAPVAEVMHFHLALSYIEKWGGTLTSSTRVDEGVVVTVALPKIV